MPTPIPATDAQLLQLAQRAAQAWTDNVLRDFDNRWRTEQAAEALLSDVPAEQRDVMADRLARFVERWHDRLMTVVAQHRGAIANQAYAVLAAMDPRPSGHDLGDVAAADRLAAGAVAATTAQQEAAARIEDIGKHVEEFAEAAAPLAGMQQTIEAHFARLAEELAERIARTSRIRALIDAHPEHDALLAAIGTDLWTAQAAAADQLARLTDSEDEFNRVLRPFFDGTATEEQQPEIMAAFDAHLPAAAEASTALGAELEALAESAIDYFCTPPTTTPG